jgi:hypothetical protein
MKEGVFNQILGIKIVVKSCFNGLKTISSPMKIYNPVITSNRSTVYNKKIYVNWGFRGVRAV